MKQLKLEPEKPTRPDRQIGKHEKHALFILGSDEVHGFAYEGTNEEKRLSVSFGDFDIVFWPWDGGGRAGGSGMRAAG
ncbi:hypothetical protein HDU78_010582, partial [Chytriomyces hyalinus]